ncbi:Acetyl esterase/lipase [Fervidobacterium changbaicum]|uniref:Alpha/beta hydrolase n=1 Tax=Fervidobacterium changbaicum TaxID=310769 RepID=A0ABX5QS24_9BACT|nr:alpha/beta hydrolase [Fervidobacterium changbaicum]QAV33269.1 alpha/beta hydrolase [Fervidobacterium changbaicum]SDH06706.1 Acetyl esterase/lipase [Fervidobacterium changbaicum]
MTRHISIESKIAYQLLKFINFSKIVEVKMLKDTFNKSPALPGYSLCNKVEVHSFQTLGRSVWEITPKTANSSTTILFLHGGAYISNLTKMHWKFVEKLIECTSATVYVPDYPLAPEYIWKDTYMFLDELYTLLLEKHGERNIVFMGDSAGGGLALGFTLKLRDESKRLPDHVVLFSAWLDLSLSNPELEQYEKRDVMLTVKGLKAAAQRYAGNEDANLKDPRLSPIYGDFSNLCQITVFTGTNDLLHPDSKKLREVCEVHNLPLNYFEYPTMFYDWVIFTFLPESKDALKKIRKILR